MTVKTLALHCMRALGLFALCRRLTRSKLRILCYHGFSIGDQHRYNPMLFMTPATFERRLRLLKRLGYPVITLDEAVARLLRNDIGACETVVTIDDGWRTTHDLAAPVMKSLGVAATIYVTTYYCERGTDVFPVLVNYLLWRARPESVHVAGIHPKIDGTYRNSSGHSALADDIITRADAHLNGQEKQRLAEYLAATFGAEAGDSLLDGRFKLITPAQVTELAADGFDIQLHTHRHRLSMHDRAAVEREINDNRRRLDDWTRARTHHFCYPSGQHVPAHGPWLRALQVDSATTCEPGLNDSRSDVFRLRRFLDSEALSEIEFEAELAGIGTLLRALRGKRHHSAQSYGEATPQTQQASAE